MHRVNLSVDKKNMPEVGTVARCLLCNSVFVMVVDVVPSSASFRGRSGKAQLDAHLAGVQERHCKGAICVTNTDARPQTPATSTTDAGVEDSDNGCMSLRMWRCPTCNELAGGVVYQEWVQDQAPARLSPCALLSFSDTEDMAPLYSNANHPEKKPKWQLAQGLGPRGLELDKSRSGRLHKPTLRQFGVPVDQVSSKNAENVPDFYQHVLDTVESALMLSTKDSQWQVCDRLIECCPVYEAWDVLGPFLEEIARGL